MCNLHSNSYRIVGAKVSFITPTIVFSVFISSSTSHLSISHQWHLIVIFGYYCSGDWYCLMDGLIWRFCVFKTKQMSTDSRMRASNETSGAAPKDVQPVNDGSRENITAAQSCDGRWKQLGPLEKRMTNAMNGLKKDGPTSCSWVCAYDSTSTSLLHSALQR